MFPVEDNGTGFKAPGRAASATSPESTASLKHQRSRMARSHKQNSSAIASPRDVPSSDLGGASTPKKPKKSRCKRKAIGDLSAQDHPAFTTPSLHPPPATPLTASSRHAEDDTSSLSQDSVVRPGICSPLRTAFSPGPAGGLPPPSKLTGASAFKEKDDATIVLPIIIAVVVIGVVGAVIFTIVVRGHRVFKHAYLKSNGRVNTTDTAVISNVPAMVFGSTTGQHSRPARRKAST